MSSHAFELRKSHSKTSILKFLHDLSSLQNQNEMCIPLWDDTCTQQVHYTLNYL